MAGNNAIQFLRGSGSNKSDILQDGQPYFDKTNNLLFIGKDNKKLSELSPISSYSTVIATQTAFENWCNELDAGTYKGTSVLILEGTYSRGINGLHLPYTLRQLHGLGIVQINVTGFSHNTNNKAAIWYDKVYNDTAYSIKNIAVSCRSSSSGTTVVSFYNCANMTNCISRNSLDTPSIISEGFVNCVNLTNCFSSSTTNNGSSFGFAQCTNLTNCTSTCNVIGSIGDSFGFCSCNNLVNCTGTGTFSGNPSGRYGHAFSNCNICSNCRNDPDYPSTTETWGGANTNIDLYTCPEYLRSWPVIARLASIEMLPLFFNIGDEVPFKVLSNTYHAVLIGFNHDDKSDNSGKAKSTWLIKEVYDINNMNNSDTTSGGWQYCNMRTTIMQTIFSLLPEDLQKVIVEVNKKTKLGSGTAQIGTTSDKLFLLSSMEVYGDIGDSHITSGEGTQYEYYSQIATDNNKKIKKFRGQTEGWWLRTLYGNHNYCFVDGDGSLKDYAANTAFGTAFAFCI